VGRHRETRVSTSQISNDIFRFVTGSSAGFGKADGLAKSVMAQRYRGENNSGVQRTSRRVILQVLDTWFKIQP
jgi:hypothetical protein